MKCDVCGFPLTRVFVGVGDGTGQRFAHEGCYVRKRLLELAAQHEPDLVKKAEAHLLVIQIVDMDAETHLWLRSGAPDHVLFVEEGAWEGGYYADATHLNPRKLNEIHSNRQ